MKHLVARALAKRVQNGQTIGLGSGTTTELALTEIGKRIQQEGLRIKGIPTSHQTALLAGKAGIEVLSGLPKAQIDWAFDGADEVDPRFAMLKGRGGAMLSEKIIAKRTANLVIIVAEEKLVDRLGDKFPVPIECIPDSVSYVESELYALGAKEITLRLATGKYGPIITEQGNLIFDTTFPELNPLLAKQIKDITGVVEHGLFYGLLPELLIAKSDGVWSRVFEGGAIKETLLEPA